MFYFLRIIKQLLRVFLSQFWISMIEHDVLLTETYAGQKEQPRALHLVGLKIGIANPVFLLVHEKLLDDDLFSELFD